MKLRVLIADPDPDLQRTITAALSQERDMEAAGFSSGGTETLSQIQSLRPDVVLLELVQPRLDGLSVLRRLAEAESAPPVVVLTGFVNAAVVAECAKLGAAYFIPKPCDTAALMQCLRQCAKAGGKSPAAAAAPAPVAAHLEMFENHHSHQMSDMQRVGRGVDAQIGRRHLFFELFLCAGHDRVDHAAPFQFLDEVLDCHIVFVLIFSR